MEFNLSSLATFLTAVIGFGMPYAISFVAKSTKRWLNRVIAYGSSVLVGAFTAWTGGQFGADFFLNAMVAIAATQLAYNAYWKDVLKKTS